MNSSRRRAAFPAPFSPLYGCSSDNCPKTIKKQFLIDSRYKVHFAARARAECGRSKWNMFILGLLNF